MPEPSTPIGQDERVEVVAKVLFQIGNEHLKVDRDWTPLADIYCAEARRVLAALDAYDREKLREVTVGAGIVGRVIDVLMVDKLFNSESRYDARTLAVNILAAIREQPAESPGRDGERRWRVGRKVGRTIYAMRSSEATDADELIGVMDTAKLAESAVEAHNARLPVEGRDGEDDREWTLAGPARKGFAAAVFGKPLGASDLVDVVPKSSRDARDREIERLTDLAETYRKGVENLRYGIQARIERAKRAEDQVEKLREALRPLLRAARWIAVNRVRSIPGDRYRDLISAFKAADAALASSNSDGGGQ